MLWRMSAGPTKERPMPMAELNVTKPNPVLDNYWRQLAAAKAAAPPPPPWPAIEAGLLEEEGRPRLPVFPLQVFPGQWRGGGKDAAHRAGASGGYIAQALRGSAARP